MNSRDKEILGLYGQGDTQAEIARSLNVSRQRIHQVLVRHGLNRHDGGLVRRRELCFERADDLLKMHIKGLSVEKIAEKMSVKTKTIKDIMAEIGIFSGIPKNVKTNKYSNACCIHEWGVDMDTWNSLVSDKGSPVTKFLQYRKNMRQMYPEVKWDLKFGDWWHVWQQSRKYENMGSSGDKYCMTRKDREQGFEKDNMSVIKFRDLFSKK